jgi:mono/diheme cytochrome c family protein
MKLVQGGILFVSLMAAAPQFASAQAGAGASLTDQQLLGRRIFTQSCGVCHSKPVITAGQYGPVLSKTSLDGNAELVAGVISNGTARMPGFKYTYTPEQISAIAAYIGTIPVAAAPAAPAKNNTNGPAE